MFWLKSQYVVGRAMSYYQDPNWWYQYPYGYYPQGYVVYPDQTYRPRAGRSAAATSRQADRMPAPAAVEQSRPPSASEKHKEREASSSPSEAVENENENKKRSPSQEKDGRASKAASPQSVGSREKDREKPRRRRRRRHSKDSGKEEREAARTQQRTAERRSAKSQSAKPVSPERPPRRDQDDRFGKAETNVDEQIQCPCCYKWVAKRGFEQHWEHNLSCREKQMKQRGQKPDVDRLAVHYQCKLCYKWLKGEYGYRQHMERKHRHLGQRGRYRSRSPSGSADPGPSASQVGRPASVLSAHRPPGGRPTKESPLRLKERPSSHASGSQSAAGGSKVAAVQSGSQTEDVAALLQATANLLRRQPPSS